jgi:hypothetical protein
MSLGTSVVIWGKKMMDEEWKALSESMCVFRIVKRDAREAF